MDHTARSAFSVGMVLSLALSAFFAAAETALVSLGRIDLQRMREKRRPARRDHPEPQVADLPPAGHDPDRAEPLQQRGLRARDDARHGWVGETWGVPAAILFSTVALFVFAEMTPKAIGAASPVAISRAVAVPMAALMKVLSPIATLVVG